LCLEPFSKPKATMVMTVDDEVCTNASFTALVDGAATRKQFNASVNRSHSVLTTGDGQRGHCQPSFMLCLLVNQHGSMHVSLGRYRRLSQLSRAVIVALLLSG
jgi:hypothetical protein